MQCDNKQTMLGTLLVHNEYFYFKLFFNSKLHSFQQFVFACVFTFLTLPLSLRRFRSQPADGSQMFVCP